MAVRVTEPGGAAERTDRGAGVVRGRGVGLWVRLAGAAGAGAALVLASPPYDLWPVAFLSVGVLALVTRGVRARRGALLGLAFGLAFFVPLLRWSGIFVGPAPWLLLAASQAAFLAALGGGLAVVSRLPGWPAWGAALWVAVEATRSRLPFGGFPWGRLAFSQADSPLAWLAAYGGAPLVTLAVALTGGLLAAVAVRPPRVRTTLLTLLGIAAATGAATAAGSWQTGSTRSVTVAVVQGNVPRLGLDFNAQRERVLRNHVEGTLALARDVEAGRVPRPDLVLWPENASDIDPFADAGAHRLIDGAARAVGVPILVGTLTAGPTLDTIHNVGVVWDPAGGPGERYVKRHPVPFGEYIPLRPLARMVSREVDRVRRDFVGGDRPGTLTVGPVTVGDVICFEVAYDGLVRDVAGAGLLVVQTNNATFGDSAETWQQLAMGRLRAIEHGRTVLVAATSGVSAVIDAGGQVQERSAVFTADVLVRTVEVRERTTLAGRLGAGPEWVVLAVAVGALAAAAARRRRLRPGGAVEGGGT